MQKLLYIFPDAILDYYVQHHTLITSISKKGNDSTVLIRSRLLHALVQICVIAGRMQTIRQLFLAGERTLEELTKYVYVDDFTQNV